LNIFFGNPEGCNSTIIKIRYFAEMKFVHHYWFYYTLICFHICHGIEMNIQEFWHKLPHILFSFCCFVQFDHRRDKSSLNLKCGVLDLRSLSFSSVECIVHLELV
jgi:hypothetical protein